MKIAISAESTIDLTEELKAKFDIKTVPFTVLLGDKSGYDGEITSEQIISFVNENKILPKTGAVSEFQYEEHFTSLLKDYDAVIHFSLSSKLSSAYANASKVAQKMQNVFVVDTLSLSTGIALIALYARELANKDLSPEEICQKCTKRLGKLQVSFALKRLDYLYKGGRCGALAFFGANVFKIRPQILVKDGKMISGKKYKGKFANVINNYVRDVLDEFNTPDLTNVFLTYTTASDEILQSVQAVLKARGFKNVYLTKAGATITSHCGEDCLGILYLNDVN